MNLPATPLPDFADAAVLRAHIADTMAFYHPRAIDPEQFYPYYSGGAQECGFGRRDRRHLRRVQTAPS